MAQFVATQQSDDENNDGGKFVSCDTIRRKITLFLATKEMTQKAFLAAIGNVNSNSFGRFRKLKGPYSGCDNGTYEGAKKFFARQKQKASEKKPLRKRSMPDSNSSAQPPRKIVAADIVLPEDLPVYDDCDEVRSKIAQYFHKDGVSQSAFAKAIDLTPRTVSNFLAKRGPNAGAGSHVYPAAYRFFEKRRLQNGEAKSKRRLQNEATNAQGFPLENPPTHVWMCKDDRKNFSF